MDLQLPGLIHLTKRKRRAGNPVLAADTSSQSPHEGRLAAAQVRDKLDNLTAPKIGSELLGELLGSFGTGGVGLPCLYGTHIRHIVPRGH